MVDETGEPFQVGSRGWFVVCWFVSFHTGTIWTQFESNDYGIKGMMLTALGKWLIST